jgi:signal transduction histidine kinase
MLADVLEGQRDRLADELERRAAVAESTELPIASRRKRLNGLVQEVIGALRAGGIGDEAQQPPALPPTTDLALELKERELVQRYLIDQIEQKRLSASTGEIVVVTAWVTQAERALLREQTRRLSTLLEDVQESALLLGPDERILYCNLRASERLHEMVGVPRDRIIGKTPAELGMPGELMIGCPIGDLARRARAHQSFEMIAWGRAKEGQLDAIYRPDGSVDAVALVVRDVHDRKLAQTRLETLTKLSTTVGLADYDNVAEAVARVPIPQFADWCAVNVIDGKRITRTSLAHRNPAEAPLRAAILRAVPAWDRHPLWDGMMARGFQLLAEVSDDLLRRLAISDEQYHLLSQLAIRSILVVPLVSRGQLTGIITCIYTAESDRRYSRDDPALAEELALHAAQAFENARLMKELKSTEARFRIALAGAQTSVYEQDRSLRYVWHYSPVVPVDMLGKTHEESCPAEEAALLTALKRRVLDEGETVQEEMDRTLWGQGRRHFRETMAALRDHKGRIVGVIGASTDITEQQRARQQITEALGFRERMMGVLGHDLRNPMGAIAMVSDLLLRRQDLPGGVRDQMVRLRRSAGRVQEMIDTLLDFTRARFLGQVPMAAVPCDLGDIARAVVDEERAAWPDRQIDLDACGDLDGEWDPARISQMISNLVGNAIDHGDRGTPVRISIDGERPDVELKVHNHGLSIPPEVMPILFEPFRRGAVEDRSPHGVGLGLYIVEQIVHAHHGSVGVESTAETGTTFTVRLPRARGPSPG